MKRGQANGIGGQRASASSFLSALPPAAGADLEAIRVTTTYPPGAVLFVEGEEPRGVFVLLSGRAKLSIGSSNGRVMILRIARPGEVVGLHGVVSTDGFQATAETIEPCQVSFVRRDEFLRFLREHPAASLEAARQLSASYQEACEQLRAIGLCGSARKKVARFILEWAEDGERREGGIYATLTLTHEEIGQLVGASRETITRALGEFKSREWIAIKGSALCVKDETALRRLVGDDNSSSWAEGHVQTEQERGARPYINLRKAVTTREIHS